MPTYRAPPDERTKGVLRIVVADKFTGSQIGEIADLLGFPAGLISGSTKSERAGSIIRRLAPDKLKELVGMVFGDGFVRPGPTSETNLAAEAALRAACVVDGIEDPPSVVTPSSGFSRDLFDELQQHGFHPLRDVPSPTIAMGSSTPTAPEHHDPAPPPRPVAPEQSGPPAVFVVHGHDSGKREAVARLIERQGLEAIVLDEQSSEGKTVIEKFEKHAARVEYAVVLLTADDIGGTKATPPEELQPRARQNAVFELGYFAGRIDRSNVCALLEDNVEVPSDLGGVVYVPLDPGGAWRMKLAKEMKGAGLPIDLNKL